MTVELLKALVLGLPGSSEVKFAKDGKLVDVAVVAITRHNGVPDLQELRLKQNFHDTHESIVLTDEETIKEIQAGMTVKVVWRWFPGKEAR